MAPSGMADGAAVVRVADRRVQNADGASGENLAKTGGCWSMGKLYPEGAISKPDLRSRIAIGGYFQCIKGQWVHKDK